MWCAAPPLAGATAVLALVTTRRVAAGVVLIAVVVLGAGVPVAEAVVPGSPAPGAYRDISGQYVVRLTRVRSMSLI